MGNQSKHPLLPTRAHARCQILFQQSPAQRYKCIVDLSSVRSSLTHTHLHTCTTATDKDQADRRKETGLFGQLKKCFSNARATLKLLEQFRLSACVCACGCTEGPSCQRVNLYPQKPALTKRRTQVRSSMSEGKKTGGHSKNKTLMCWCLASLKDLHTHTHPHTHTIKQRT